MVVIKQTNNKTSVEDVTIVNNLQFYGKGK